MYDRTEIDDQYLTEINVTPFVDILLILLVIFLITLPLVIKTIPLNLPKASSNQEQVLPTSFYVAVDDKGEYFLDGTKTLLDPLIENLKQQEKSNPDMMVIIEADEKNSYGKVVELIGFLKGAGFAKVGLSVREKKN